MSRMVLALTLGIWLIGPAPTLAQDASGAQVVAPPARPLPITTSQMIAIERVCRQPQHADAASTRASYRLELFSRHNPQYGGAHFRLIIPSQISS